MKSLVLSLVVVALGVFTPVNAQSSSRSNSPAPQSSDNVGLEGYCPVCVVVGKGWVKGSPEFASTYDGKTYYFPGADVKQMFDAAPSKYVPALGGDCVVCLKKIGERVPGKIQHASIVDGRLFLFPDDATKKTFEASPAEFTNVDLAADGDCVVCAKEIGKTVKGVAEFTTVMNGIRYQFPGADQLNMFVSNPSKYVQTTSEQGTGAYLEITLKIKPENRAAAAGVYKKYKQPFLDQIAGATSKTLLIRDDDVQVLHGFVTVEQANGYLSTELFNNDVVTALKPYLAAAPEVRIYTTVE